MGIAKKAGGLVDIGWGNVDMWNTKEADGGNICFAAELDTHPARPPIKCPAAAFDYSSISSGSLPICCLCHAAANKMKHT